MTVPKIPWYGQMRNKCFFIGYYNLFAIVVDISCHLLIVATLTNGFECDVDIKRLEYINWPWLESFLVAINVGTHGFYPFPLVLSNHNNIYVEYLKISVEPKCYPGMLHVYFFDILNFLINIVWLKFVLSYVGALHMKKVEPMRVFFGISIVKVIINISVFAYRPSLQFVDYDVYWNAKILDLFVSAIFLFVINAYINEIRREQAPVIDQPPLYTECLFNGTAPQEEKLDLALTLSEEENKKVEETEKA